VEAGATMNVRYIDGRLSSFTYKVDDYITIVLSCLTGKDLEDERYYHGTITEIDEGGIWCVLDNDKKEKYFAFADIENVLDGNRVPFFAGLTKRSKRG
jgi:hypothetical protein